MVSSLENQNKGQKGSEIGPVGSWLLKHAPRVLASTVIELYSDRAGIEFIASQYQKPEMRRPVEQIIGEPVELNGTQLEVLAQLKVMFEEYFKQLSFGVDGDSTKVWEQFLQQGIELPAELQLPNGYVLECRFESENRGNCHAIVLIVKEREKST